jgi:hypothetical protein
MSSKQGAGVRLEAEHARAAVEAAFATFGPGNPQGVFGVAVGPKHVRGRRTAISTLVLFVRRKLDAPSAPVEPVSFKYRGALREVMPDVVATGRAVELAAGGRPNYSGLYAGSALRAESTKAVAGAVTCLLGPPSGPTHLLTAGHLFASGFSKAKVKAARGPSKPEEEVGRLARSLLDDPRGGPPVDAALVELTSAGRSMARETGQTKRLPRLSPDVFDSAHVASVWLKVFLATTGDYTARLEGSFSPNAFHATSPFGAPQTLRDVIVTGFAHNAKGDSGTVLMTERGSPEPSAVGLMVARTGTLSLYEPLDFVLSKLKPELGPNSAIWSH